MSVIGIFGRITADREICKKIAHELCKFIVMCYEGVDDGCSAPHCHFVAETKREYKNLASFRQAFSKLCKQYIGKPNQYSVKIIDPSENWKAYLCKGSKKTKEVKPEILINDINLNVEECHKEFHQNRENFKKDKHDKPIWREFEAYIQETNPAVFTHRFHHQSILSVYKEVADALYDYYLMKDKMFLSDTVMRSIVQTVTARNVKKCLIFNKACKKDLTSRWVPKEDWVPFNC